MTIDQITKAVTAFKPVSKRQVFRYLRDFKIKPTATRQRPQQYPDHAAEIILIELGFAAGNVVNGAIAKLPTMPQLRATRAKARGK